MGREWEGGEMGREWEGGGTEKEGGRERGKINTRGSQRERCCVEPPHSFRRFIHRCYALHCTLCCTSAFPSPYHVHTWFMRPCDMSPKKMSVQM